MTFMGYLEPTRGPPAFDLAYSDVARAFEQFLAEIGPGKPFVLAGHSQGR